jgi:hypothetical protein
MMYSGIQGDSVAQQTMGSVAPYLLRSVLMRIPLLTLVMGVMRYHFSREVFRSHNIWQEK